MTQTSTSTTKSTISAATVSGPALGDLTEDDILAASAASDEPTWLRDRRQQAFKGFLDASWPDSRLDEYWRSTPFKRFPIDLPIVREGVDHSGGAAPVTLLQSLDDRTARATWLDGKVTEVHIREDLAESGFVLEDLATAAAGEHGDIIREHLGSLTTTGDGTGANDDRTIAANDAAWTAGLFVYLPAELELPGPIGIHIHVATPGAYLPRVLVVAERHSKGRVYLEHSSMFGTNALVDEVVEVVLGQGAKVEVASLQEWGDGVHHMSLQKAAVGRHAEYRHAAVNIGGGTLRIRPEVDLVGEGASCFPLGVYFADGGQHFDMQPYIRHIAANAKSDVLYKGALQGNSRCVFRGNVWVGAEAFGTDTKENNRTLILTEGARADSTPFLEIFCSDITASHGSATGQIDEDHLFYLQARGLTRAEAVRLIVFGFFRGVLDVLDLPGIQERTMTHIEREIDQVDLAAVGVKLRHLPGADGLVPAEGEVA